MRTFFRYGLRSSWKGRVETPAALGAKFVGTLDALSRIDPVLFASWELFDLRAKRQLEEHLIATMGCYRPNSSLE
jgi:hypothetical protein